LRLSKAKTEDVTYVAQAQTARSELVAAGEPASDERIIRYIRRRLLEKFANVTKFLLCHQGLAADKVATHPQVVEQLLALYREQLD
jgi:hypothetical protein